MPPVPSNNRLRLRRDTPERWAQVNPILADGEPGYERGTGQLKVGDGVTAWNSLPYFVPMDPEAGLTLFDHIESEAPHPFYDDGRDFSVLYHNVKV